ncbi:MAG TPA: condensation domain-containing protein [Actinophytocola sp.]|uniref:condensation domain-containing protein n=1 Tax=Actinophytocola sp. TaxID=1872138 RepID=UPI002DBEC780|nr:condensation domain-containing protein [Actinophytocola sp.]HEU5469124.1 condensation domain-containing protein [Actinophytocola sp.]
MVPFEGDGSGVEELTWSQMTLWQSIEQSGQSKTVPYVTELPPGTSVDRVAAELRFMVGRHQSLRTRLVFDAGPVPRQRCATSGEIPLEVVDAGDADPAEVAEQVSERYQKVDFAFETEWPVRMAVIRSGGVLTHQVLVILHTAIDAYGLSALWADLAARDPDTGAAAGPVRATQPLEQARKQASPAGQRHNTASLAYLERVLNTVSASRFGDPRYPGDRTINQITFHSPAALLAIRSVAARTGINTSPVLLASFAVGLARFTGVNPVLAMLLVSNRFRPGLAAAVSPQILLTPYLIDVADISLDEAVNRATQSALNAYKNAYYNPYQQDEVIERVERRRGEEIDLSCFYNDRRQQDRGGAGEPPTVAEITAALSRSTVSFTGEIHPPRRKLYFNVDELPGVIEFLVSADSRYFSLADMETLVRGVEAVAVETALDGAVPTGVRDRATV